MSYFEKKYIQLISPNGPVSYSPKKHNLDPTGEPIKGPMRLNSPVALSLVANCFLYIEKDARTATKPYKIHKDFRIDSVGNKAGEGFGFQGGISLSRLNLIRILLNMEESDRLIFCKPEVIPRTTVRDAIVEDREK